jgi:hypothetical protein
VVWVQAWLVGRGHQSSDWERLDFLGECNAESPFKADFLVIALCSPVRDEFDVRNWTLSSALVFDADLLEDLARLNWTDLIEAAGVAFGAFSFIASNHAREAVPVLHGRILVAATDAFAVEVVHPNRWPGHQSFDDVNSS